MKFLKHILTIAALFTINPGYIQSAAQKSRRTTAAPAKTARARTARKAPVKQSPVVQQPRATPFSYNQILSSLKTVTPTNADYGTLLSIRTEIDRQIATLQNQDIVQKINNIDDTILDVMENAGGHAIARHVDQSQSDMVLRLARENIEATSTFTDKATAIKAVKENLRHNAQKIASWLANNTGLNTKEPFYYTHSYPIGKSLIRNRGNALHPSFRSVVVLVTDPTNNLGFRIITAYPTHR